MTLQSSGAISLADVQTEFGGSNPIGINEYYGRAAGIPASGTISLADFYGKSAAVAFEFSTLVFGYSFTTISGSQTGNYSGNVVTPGAANSPKTFTVFLAVQSGGGPPYGNVTVRYYQGGSLDTTWFETRVGTYGFFKTFTFGSSSMQFTSTVYDPNIFSNVGGVAEVFWSPAQGAPADRTLYQHTHGYGNGSIYSLD